MIGLSKVTIKKLYFNKPYLQGEINLINNDSEKLDQNIEEKIIKILKEKKIGNDFYKSYIDSFQTLKSYDAKIDYAASIITESSKKREKIFNCIDIEKKITLLENL